METELVSSPTGGSERSPPAAGVPAVGRSGHADVVTRNMIYAKNGDVTNRESKEQK